MFYVQRNHEDGGWISELKPCDSLEDAKEFANALMIGDAPEAIRIVDDQDKVCAWVGRNGFRPGRALSPVKSEVESSRAMETILPAKLSWQDGKTAGEIALIRFVQIAKSYLNTPDDYHKQYLLREADDLLKWYGVIK